ncbi:MAG: hypothetical protein ABH833_00345, partial [Parcubacteria group bacterium]
MTQKVDPTKAKLYPEELPEAIVTTASASGAAIASYAAFSPYAMTLRKLWTGQTPAVTLRIDSDSGHAVLESPLVSRPARLPVDIDLMSHDSMDMWAVGSAFESYFAYTLRIAKLNVFEKIKHSVTLTETEKTLADEFEIKKKYLAGILRGMDVPQFKKIYEIAKKVTVTAGSNTRVGRIINVKKGEKAVLIGIAVDRDAIDTAFGGPGANDTYYTLNRDVIDTAHIKLDCLAMPSIDYEIPCYIPAVDRHEILIESTTGVTDFPVRYRYGVANLSILEKIRWG